MGKEKTGETHTRPENSEARKYEDSKIEGEMSEKRGKEG